MSCITPGPYTVRGLSIQAITHGEYFTVAHCYCPRLTHQGNLANAKLFAAAPDLHTALQDLVAAAQFNPSELSPTHPDVQQALRALEKVK